ncbi:Regulator of chromosome condensation (RCC1) repeat protein [compost metagenome]
MSNRFRKNRRTFLKELGVLVGGSSVFSIVGLEKAQAFISTRLRKVRLPIQSLYAWGINYSNILSVPGGDPLSSPTKANTKTWAKIVGDNHFTIGMTSDGALWFWGNEGGQYVTGNGVTGVVSSPIRIGTTTWQDVAVNENAALAVRTDGTLWGWGRNYADYFPTNQPSDAVSTPIFLASAGGWATFTVNNNPANGHLGSATFVSDSAGNSYGIGANDSYQMGQGDTIARTSPVQANYLWKSLSIGKTHVIGVRTSGNLGGWGYQTNGALGNGSAAATAVSTPASIAGNTNWVSVAAGNECSLIIRNNGALYFTGNGADGTSGRGNTTTVSTPVQIGALTNWSKVSLSERHCLAIKTDGTLFAWGSNASGCMGNNSATDKFSSPVQIGSLTTWTAISAGYYSSLAIQSDGSLWAWGDNSLGQLGIGTTTSMSSPVRIGAATWSRAGSGSQMSVGIRTDGTLWAWGNIQGFTNFGITSSPVQIGTENVWSEVQCGYQYIMLVKNDGSLWNLGVNYYSQLGSSVERIYSTPVQLGSDTTWRKVAMKDWTGVVALKANGTIWNWGWQWPMANESYAIYRLKTPVQVGTGTDWKDIDSKSGNMMALKTNGTLWSWGLNRDKCGWAASFASSSTPIQIGTASDWAQFSIGTTGAYAVKTTGTLWSWGTDTGIGELGQGASGTIQTPQQVGTLTTWTEVSSRNFHALALRNDNSLWTWGANSYAQLGDLSTTNRSSPVQIAGFGWKKIFAGGLSSYARRDV